MYINTSMETYLLQNMQAVIKPAEKSRKSTEGAIGCLQKKADREN